MSDGSPFQPAGSGPYQPVQPQPGAQPPMAQQPAAPQPGTQPASPYQPVAAPTPSAPPGSAPAGVAAAAAAGGVSLSGPVLLSLLAAAGLAAAVFLKEDHTKGWDSYGVWGIFAIVAALATMAPSMAAQFKLTAERAWQVAAAGAVGVVVFWVLMILPSIERNLSFVATLATALACLAAWMAPGRPSVRDDGPQ